MSGQGMAPYGAPQGQSRAKSSHLAGQIQPLGSMLRTPGLGTMNREGLENELIGKSGREERIDWLRTS